MKLLKTLSTTASALVMAAGSLYGCGTIAANCAGTIGNALNGKHGFANNPIHSKHGRCIGTGPQQNPLHQGGPWDCFKTVGGDWNCKRPGVDPTLFPQNPN